MKKIILAMAVLFNCTFLMAQSEIDALKYVQTDINGTARYMGMAGAFGALGGDASAIKDNPAGLGIYRSSEITGTMNFMMQNSSSNWNGTITNSDDPYKTGLNNLSFVLASPTWRYENKTTGLVSSNWSFGYNRLKNLNRSVNIKNSEMASSITDFMGYFTGNIQYSDLKYTNDYEPYSNDKVPWISVMAYEGGLLKEFINADSTTNHWESLLNTGEKVTPAYTMIEKGYIDEYSIGWAGNFSNLFYLGTTLNFQKLNYSLSSSYSEVFEGPGDMKLNNDITSTGSGFNLNIGAILRPTDLLRFGFALHTPTIYSMLDHYEATLDYDNGVTYGNLGTPTDGQNYFQIQGPMQLNVSGAVIVGKKGILSAEYNYRNFTGTRLMSEDGSTQAYNNENERMNLNLNDSHTLKIGGEYKLSDNFALRAGYAITTNSTKPDAEKIMFENSTRTDTEYFLHNGTNYMTAGFGYREASWFIDCAYVHRSLDESFMPYNSNVLASNFAVTPASVITTTNNVLITFGFKF